MVAVERLPGPPWAFYLTLTAAFVIAGTGLQWLDGSVPAGTVRPILVANDVLAVYGLAAFHYLKKAVRPALETFRPALGELEPQFELLHYELTTMSRRAGLLVLLVGAAFALGSFLQAPESWGVTVTTSVAGYLFVVVEAFVQNIFLLVFVILAFRQLGVIRRIHRTATNVTLLQGGAHNAFSRLTLRASIGVAFPVYVFSLGAVASEGFLVGMGVADAVGALVLVSTASLLFFAPLYGMHRRLVEEKAAASVGAARAFERTAEVLHDRIERGEFDQLEGLNHALDSLVIERDTLRRASTWPWEAETLRGFLSSIGLPIFLWLVTYLLGRLLGE